MYSHVTAGSAYMSKFCIKRAICLASTASSSFHCVHFGSARKPILWQTMCADKQVMSPVWKTGLRFQFSNHQKLKILPKIAKTTKTLVPGIKLFTCSYISYFNRFKHGKFRRPDRKIWFWYWNLKTGNEFCQFHFQFCFWFFCTNISNVCHCQEKQNKNFRDCRCLFFLSKFHRIMRQIVFKALVWQWLVFLHDY